MALTVFGLQTNIPRAPHAVIPSADAADIGPFASACLRGIGLCGFGVDLFMAVATASHDPPDRPSGRRYRSLRLEPMGVSPRGSQSAHEPLLDGSNLFADRARGPDSPQLHRVRESPCTAATHLFWRRDHVQPYLPVHDGALGLRHVPA